MKHELTTVNNILYNDVSDFYHDWGLDSEVKLRLMKILEKKLKHKILRKK